MIGKAQFPPKAFTYARFAGCASTGIQAGSPTGTFSSIAAGSNVDLTASLAAV